MASAAPRETGVPHATRDHTKAVLKRRIDQALGREAADPFQ